jgi:hypothetical protein
MFKYAPVKTEPEADTMTFLENKIKKKKTHLSSWISASNYTFLENLARGRGVSLSVVVNDALDFFVSQYTGVDTPETLSVKIRQMESGFGDHEKRIMTLETKVEVLKI